MCTDRLKYGKGGLELTTKKSSKPERLKNGKAPQVCGAPFFSRKVLD